MNMPRFSVRRPVFTTMVTLIVVVIGAVALSRLRIDLLPDIELPTISIRTEYAGASPEVVERLVTQVIEEVVGTVPGVEEMTSESSEGQSQVRVTFTWGTDLDIAAQDIQARLDSEIDELPEDITRPRVSKFDISAFPVVVIGISSGLDPVELTELIDKQVRYRFARTPGVAQADLFGGFVREVRVELDPGQMTALHLPLDEVIASIRDANLDLSTGTIERGRYEVSLRAPALFNDLDELGRTVVAMRQGAPVTLDQVARVRDTYQRLERIVRVNGRTGLRIGIRKQADANTVEVSRRVLEEIDAVNRDFPQIRVVPVINQGNFIERSIQNVANSVMYGGLLAILVLLFFLRSLPSTIVIALSIPISIIATFSLIFFGGLTLNLMTLGGLALGVGMMVDSSIVVLENIFRRRQEDREDAVTASVAGASEVGPAIVASTLTTVVIFLPLVFVRGVSGVLFKELAYVIVFSLVCSLLVALSLVPMLASRLLGRFDATAADARPGWLERLSDSAGLAFAALDDTYRDLLRLALRHRPTTLMAALLLLAGSLLLIPLIGTEFLPPSDEGEVRVTGEMEVGSRLALVDRQSRRMEGIVLDEIQGELQAWSTNVGSTFQSNNPAQGEMRISLVPARQRKRSNTEVAAELRKRLRDAVAGMTIRTRAPQGQFLLDRLLGGDQGLTVEVRGFDLQTLELLSARALELVEAVPGVTDVDSDREPGVPQEVLRIDRAKASDLGLSVRRVTEALEIAVAGGRAGEYRTAGNSYDIRVQLRDPELLTLDEVLDLTLTTPTGEHVALRNLVESRPDRGPVLIHRKDQQRLVRIQANIAGRDTGSVAAEVQQRLRSITRPVGYDLRVAGNYEEQQEAFGELLVSLVLALVLVYMVLACQYESLIDPLIVMFSVPVAAVGVLLTLFLTGTTLNVQSYIGCIMLGGIVVNNAILLVDQAGQLRRAGVSTADSIAEAGRRRLRPILMTTLTTILGLVPLALGIGEGADAQAPLARAVVGGLTGSTLITLVLIPVLYSLVHRDRHPSPLPAS